MKTISRRPVQSLIPGYDQNAVLQLILASGVGFIMYHLTRIILLIVDADPNIFPSYFTGNIALQPLTLFYKKFWTIFTYAWVHNGFWELFSNMIWLYCFGSVVQMLIGHRQIIPLFIFSIIMGGVFYELAQLIPGETFQNTGIYFGAQAGVMGLAVASLTISPSYRLYFGERFSIPLVVIACIFFGLAVMNSNLHGANLMLLAGGALTGFTYIRLLHSGYKPGTWVYDIFDRLTNTFTPNETGGKKQNKKRSQVLGKMPVKNDNDQKRIDDILDKINQHGYNALTKEEKEILLRAGKDDNP